MIVDVPNDPQAYSARIIAARDIIHRSVLWSLGACVVPLPGADVVAAMAVQVRMLGQLSALYGVSFREDLARKVTGSLLASLGGFGVGLVVYSSLVKLLPGFGAVIGLVSAQVFVAGFTHALGRVFVMHLEAGGTLLDFDPRRVREHFRREFEAGKQVAARMQREQTATPTAGPVAAGPVAAAAPGVVYEARSDVVIIGVNARGAVKRSQSDEYAEIANRGENLVDLSGWTLESDGTGQTFTFPAGTTLASGQRIRVYTDEVHAETGGFKFGVKRAVWNDQGDRARLRDAAGALVSQFAYGDKQ